MFFLKKSQIKNSNLKIPEHIAIIMDGNSRWAQARKLPLKVGHKTGSENVRKIAENCIELGVKNLTIYAFSSENWDRPKEEVEYLMKLLEDYLEKETKPLMEKDIKIVISGNLDRLSQSVKSSIKSIEDLTNNNKSLLLNVAFSYGSRQEIVNAAKNIALAVSERKITVDEIDERVFAENLYRPEMSDPDLLIRTAGDLRVSNFLLWQLAYSELYFTEVFWPDFNKNHLIKAIQEFNQRDRRYGKR